MKIYTLWKHEGDCMPWLIDSVDEYTIDEHSGYPDDYEKKRNEPGVRELVLNFPDTAVVKLFQSPTVTATASEE